jgi:hypothetical protein
MYGTYVVRHSSLVETSFIQEHWVRIGIYFGGCATPSCRGYEEEISAVLEDEAV